MKSYARTVTERLASEGARRALARLCPPHPRGQVYWTKSDWATPSVRRCGRCGRTVVDQEIDDG